MPFLEWSLRPVLWWNMNGEHPRFDSAPTPSVGCESCVQYGTLVIQHKWNHSAGTTIGLMGIGEIPTDVQMRRLADCAYPLPLSGVSVEENYRCQSKGSDMACGPVSCTT